MTARQTPLFIGVDWGTSNLRAWLVDNNGQALATINSDKGLLNAGGEFATILQQCIGPWLDSDGTIPVLMSGMVGSRTGWREAPYTTGVLSAEKLAAERLRLECFNSGNTWIIPGYCARSCNGQFDVMRGEEIQIVGALSLIKNRGEPSPDFICLPGTHNKWAALSDGQVSSFSTTLTGELFNLLSRHSIIAQSLDASAPWDEDAFIDGVNVSGTRAGLLHQLFSVRARHLAGEHDGSQGKAYLSGLLIGADIRSMLPVNQRAAHTGSMSPVNQRTTAHAHQHNATDTDHSAADEKTQVVVIAGQPLMDNYLRALAWLGVDARGIDSTQATLTGMMQVVKDGECINQGNV